MNGIVRTCIAHCVTVSNIANFSFTIHYVLLDSENILAIASFGTVRVINMLSILIGKYFQLSILHRCYNKIMFTYYHFYS